MTFLAAPIWNQIAEEQELETPAAKVAFRLDANQLAKMEDLWMKAEQEAGTAAAVQSSLRLCLPILVESDAINEFVAQNPEFRSALPEMNSPQEAADLMQMEWRLTDQQKDQLIEALLSPESLERWHQAALQTAE